MCGLVGVAGAISLKDVDVFKQLLYVDYLRGEHSCGVGAVHSSTAEVRVRKATCDPLMLFQLKHTGEVLNSMNRVLMGHNRQMTRGKINTVNAHPFHCGRILGAHNGTLDFSCLKDLADNREGETDSEQIIATIDELDGDIAAAIALMEGAWALSIYDSEENTISLVRNDKRPLYYCLSETRKTLYWASEAWMLRGILTRNNIKIKDIIEITPNQILTWGIPNSTQIFRDEPTITAAEGKQRVNFHGSTEDGPHPWNHWTAGQGGTGQSTNGQRGSAGSSGGDSNGKLRLEDPDYWTEYGEGWDAFDNGKARGDNPYSILEEPNAYERWREGFIESEKYYGSRPTQKDEGDKVTSLDEKREANKKKDDSKRSTLYITRSGPGSRRVTAQQFREITKNECGWCNDPIVFEDKGQFVRTHAHGDIYVCESCVKDGEFKEEIQQEAQASA